MSFSIQFRDAINLYEKESILSLFQRFLMYEKLFECIESDINLQKYLLNDIVISLRNFHQQLRINNHVLLSDFEFKFQKWLFIQPVILYNNPENVLSFSQSSSDLANIIIEKYPAGYLKRPFKDPFLDPFFDKIEQQKTYRNIDILDLFASIYSYISQHKYKDELMKRMYQEIKESLGTCVTGHVNRLLNVVNGFGDFAISLGCYEYEKAKLYSFLNKHIDIINIDKINEQVQTIINSYKELEHVEKSVLLQLLKDYTKHNWIYHNEQFKFLR